MSIFLFFFYTVENVLLISLTLSLSLEIYLRFLKVSSRNRENCLYLCKNHGLMRVILRDKEERNKSIMRISPVHRRMSVRAHFVSCKNNRRYIEEQKIYKIIEDGLTTNCINDNVTSMTRHFGDCTLAAHYERRFPA